MSDFENETINIGFVILHFNIFESTIHSVECIKDSIDTDDYKIVIVDNKSPNGSGELLKDKYEHDSKVHVILNETNVGFSAGNNVGFRYLKHKCNCRYIVVMNNDIYFEPCDILNILERDYEAYKYDVLGPSIEYHSIDGTLRYDNPVSGTYSRKRLVKEKINSLIYLALAFFHCEKVYDILLNIRNSKIKPTNNAKRNEQRTIGLPLEGCIWFFSPKFIERYEGLDEITFMYHEEEILFRKIENDNGIMMYEPDITVVHDHTIAATNTVKSNKRDNRIDNIKIRLQSVNDLMDAYSKSRL